eukprot:m.1315125 g.1315125  ORF g.1315125 m.1315125 type:complete len:1170 (+) comp24835_c0_seq70:89-3598(+)
MTVTTSRSWLLRVMMAVINLHRSSGNPSRDIVSEISGSPTHLLLEYLPSPVLGVDVSNPRFSWEVPFTTRNTTCTAYQIVVTSSDGSTVLDSGIVPTADMWRNGSVRYSGKDLVSDADYTWKVRVWIDGSSTPSRYSEPSSFSTGWMHKQEWDAALSIQASPSPSPPPAPSPPAPPLCMSDCFMVGVPGQRYFTGAYNETQTHNVSSISACQAACLADRACVQITWAPTHTDRCVMYQSITGSTSGGAQAWVKCSSNMSSVRTCTGFDPTPQPKKAPAHYLRKQFVLPDGAVRRAMLYVSAVGWARAYVNGIDVDPTNALNPGRTLFDSRHWYSVFNVTGMLTTDGKSNTVGVVAAAGWQSMPGHQLSVRALLSVTMASGARHTIPTTLDWMGSTQGPITSANIYNGETFDSRLDDAWSAPDAPPSRAFQPVTAVTEFAAVVPTWQPMQPIRKLELNRADTVTHIVIEDTHESVYVFEFPQNAAGTARITVSGCPRGTALSVYFSEVLCGYGTTRWSPPCTPGQIPGNGQFGTVDQRDLRGNWFNVYICNGSATEESWEPSFTYTGFRFAELHGHGWAPPTKTTLQQRVMHSDVEGQPLPIAQQKLPRTLAGSVAFGTAQSGRKSTTPDPAPAIDGPHCYEGENCSDMNRPTDDGVAVLDQISHNVRWDLIDNLHSVPEDCDQRNERWGWMADASVSAEGNYHYHWMPALYTSWLYSMRDVQVEPNATCATATGSQGDTNVGSDGKANCSGAVGDLTPGRTPAALPGDPSWMFAYPLVYSYQVRYFADMRLGHELWPGIEAYVGFLTSMANRGKSGLISWKKYGDWLEPGKVPSVDIIGEMSSAFNYGQAVRIASDIGHLLGYSPAADAYRQQLKSIQTAFHATFWDDTEQTYGDGTQAALIYPLYLNAVPPALDAMVFDKLVALIYNGTALCDSAPCLDTGIIATKWLMEVLSARGRTDVGLALAFKTDYPSWGYMAAQNATTIWEHWEYMNGDGMNSHAHPALASVGAWLYRWALGLRLNDGALSVPWPPDQPPFAGEQAGCGWRRVLFAPGCTWDPRLPSATGRVSTPFGPISAAWQNRTDGKGTALVLTVALPTEVRATIIVPAHVGGGPSTVVVTEGTQTVWAAGSATHASDDIVASLARGCVNLEVGSGTYTFTATHPAPTAP